ncbi:hypothetical protein JCM17380_31180 [Desulfosporosinus burensis]
MHCHWETGKAYNVDDSESGDLPVTYLRTWIKVKFMVNLLSNLELRRKLTMNFFI